jgi:hypothetical protein
MAADSPSSDPRPAPDQVAEARTEVAEDPLQAPPPEKQFRGWRLIGFLFLVIVVIGIVSAIVDIAVIPR